jgi:hypothetical protein
VRAYQRELDQSFSDYLMTRYRYYAAETRWPERPFWRQRRLPPRPIRSRRLLDA